MKKCLDSHKIYKIKQPDFHCCWWKIEMFHKKCGTLKTVITVCTKISSFVKTCHCNCDHDLT